MTPLTSQEKQSRRIAELDAIAQAAGWATWTRYATAVKRGVVSIAANPAAIAAAVAAEREACAQTVEQVEHDGTHAQFTMRRHCAAAIRAHSNGAGRE